MMDKVEAHFRRLVAYFAGRNYSQERLWRAFELAKKAHSGQTRKSGEPYIMHPLLVAIYTCEYGADEATVIAAILHDVAACGDVSPKEIEQLFGREVAALVDGVSRLGTIKKSPDKDVQELRKLFKRVDDDLRILLIKICSRLHNVRTLDSFPKYQQYLKLQETKNIYIPLAKKLNLWPAVRTMEDCCLKHFKPEVYNILFKKYEGEKSELEETTRQIKRVIQEDLGESMEKIYNIVLGQYSFTEINRQENIIGDLDASNVYYIQIILKEVEDCYVILEKMLKLYRSMNSHIVKDFMLFPKENGYKAIHASVFIPYGPMNLHIHTRETYQVANYGGFRHLLDLKSRPCSRWIDSIFTADTDAPNAIVRNELLGTPIKVYSMEGEADELPVYSKVLDYVVMKYPQTFLQIQHIKVGGQEKELLHQLHPGDVLEVAFSETLHQQVDLKMIVHANQDTTRHILSQYLEHPITFEQVYAGFEACVPWFLYFNILKFAENPGKYFLKDSRKLFETMNALGAKTLSVEDFFDSFINLDRLAMFKKTNDLHFFVIRVYPKDEDEPVAKVVPAILRMFADSGIPTERYEYRVSKNRFFVGSNFQKLSQLITLKEKLDQIDKYYHQLVPYFEH